MIYSIFLIITGIGLGQEFEDIPSIKNIIFYVIKTIKDSHVKPIKNKAGTVTSELITYLFEKYFK